MVSVGVGVIVERMINGDSVCNDPDAEKVKMQGLAATYLQSAL